MGVFRFSRKSICWSVFFDNHCSVDERLITKPEQAATLLLEVFRLFGQTLVEGFVHMDPHPRNILIGPDGALRLIDFECCAHSVLDHDFSLGFLLGYFYRYWFQRFISLADYDACCEHYLAMAHPTVNREIFQPVYTRFRDSGVSRSTRYRILTCARSQGEFLRELRSSADQPLVKSRQ